MIVIQVSSTGLCSWRKPDCIVGLLSLSVEIPKTREPCYKWYQHPSVYIVTNVAKGYPSTCMLSASSSSRPPHFKWKEKKDGSIQDRTGDLLFKLTRPLNPQDHLHNDLDTCPSGAVLDRRRSSELYCPWQRKLVSLNVLPWRLQIL